LVVVDGAGAGAVAGREAGRVGAVVDEQAAVTTASPSNTP
jgi:hypothetical protein